MLRLSIYLCAVALCAVAAAAVPLSVNADPAALDKSVAATKAPVATKVPAIVRAVTSPYVAGAPECNGTDVGSFASAQPRRRYELYREHYAGCRVVRGDLVLTKLSDPTASYNLSFLSDIEEIGGYLLIQGVLADEIPLTALHTIKGRRLYKNFYAVYVENNFLPPGGRGLRELQMPKLKSIDRGDVKIGRNPNLCFMENIEWGQLMKEQTSTLDKTNKPGELATSDRCGFCHSDCAKYCWGRGPNMCQDRSTLFLVRGDRNVNGRKPATAGANAVARTQRPCPAGMSRAQCRQQQQQTRSQPRKRTTTAAAVTVTGSLAALSTAVSGAAVPDAPSAASTRVSGSASVE